MIMIRLLSVASAYAVILLEIYSGAINGPFWWVWPGGLFLSLLTAIIIFGTDLGGSQPGNERSATTNIVVWAAILAASFGMSYISNYFGRVVLPDLIETRVPGAPAGDFTSPPPQPSQSETTPSPESDSTTAETATSNDPPAPETVTQFRFENRIWRGPDIAGTPEGSMLVFLSNGLGLSQACDGSNEVFKWRQDSGSDFIWSDIHGYDSKFRIRETSGASIEIVTGLDETPLSSNYSEQFDVFRCPDPQPDLPVQPQP